MDINLGLQKGIQKLIVYENDSPAYLAKKFAEFHRKTIPLLLIGNIELKEKVAAKLVTMIERKMAEAFEARRNIRPRSKSPEIKSREPSPTD